MDWAKNSFGILVDAASLTFSSFGLVCPKCERPVLLRRGGDRRPHFAHYKHRANPDCENYYPSFEETGQGGWATGKRAALSPRKDSLRCGLFLKHSSELDKFSLWFRIPSLSSALQLSGSLEISSGTGHKTFSSDQLTKKRMVPLVCDRTPLADFQGTGDLVQLANHLSDQISFFGFGLNLFLKTDAGGRYLLKSEPVEWGAHYWILSDSKLNPPDSLLLLAEWYQCGELNGRQIYEIRLPSRISSSHPETGKIISSFLGRLINPPRPRAYIIDPFPHHIDEDGTFIYPQPPDCLFIKRTSNHKISVDSSSDMVQDIRITEISDEWVQIKGLPDDDSEVAILISSIEQVILRVENCSLISPLGLEGLANEATWNLTEEPPLSFDELFKYKVKVNCGSPRLAKHFSKLNKNCVLEDVFLSLPSNTNKVFNAGGFGIIWEETSQKELSVQAESDMPIIRSPKIIWIEGLIRMRYGQLGITLFHNYLSSPNQINLQRVGQTLPAHLMLYIMAMARIRQQ